MERRVQRQCLQCDKPFIARVRPSRPTKGRFCSLRCAKIYRGHKPSIPWSGGYRAVLVDGEYQKEHIAMAERALGHPLPPNAVVHHVNEDRADNRNENLCICQDSSYHNNLHARLRVLQMGGDPHLDKRCYGCGKVKPRTMFSKSRIRYDGLDQRCKSCVSGQ